MDFKKYDVAGVGGTYKTLNNGSAIALTTRNIQNQKCLTITEATWRKLKNAFYEIQEEVIEND